MYLIFMNYVQFPVAPEKIQIKGKNQNKTLTLINDGEINLLKLPGLLEISFDLLLPNVEYPFASYPNGFQNAQQYLNLIEQLKHSCNPFPFNIIRMNDRGDSLDIHTNLTCSLEDYTVDENAREGFDFTVSLKLKEYRPFGTKTLTIKEDRTATVTGERPNAKPPETTHTVSDGDTLWEIAKTKLGDGNRWKEIYDLNAAVIENTAKGRGLESSAGGGYIFPGTVLKLPGGGR